MSDEDTIVVSHCRVCDGTALASKFRTVKLRSLHVTKKGEQEFRDSDFSVCEECCAALERGYVIRPTYQ